MPASLTTKRPEVQPSGSVLLEVASALKRQPSSSGIPAKRCEASLKRETVLPSIVANHGGGEGEGGGGDGDLGGNGGEGGGEAITLGAQQWKSAQPSEPRPQSKLSGSEPARQHAPTLPQKPSAHAPPCWPHCHQHSMPSFGMRLPQSAQSLPTPGCDLQSAHSAPGPPSSHSPSLAQLHEFRQMPGLPGGGGGGRGGRGGICASEKPHAIARSS